MNLERVTIALRPRTTWEAVDLGFVLARACWKPLYGAFATGYLPIALIAGIALHRHPLLAMLLLWWLKPLFDRVALRVLSTAVFGEPPNVRLALRGWRSSLSPGWLASLTLYRLDSARSFNLPVWQLERARGAIARARAAVLHKRARGTAIWLTIVCLHFELIAGLSLYGIVDLLVPAPYASEWSLLSGVEPRPMQQGMIFGFYVLSVGLVEPLYVAAGFALYLNRRTQLEAWDIELAMRRLTARRSVPAGVLAVMLSWGMALILIPVPQATAAEMAGSARAAAADVLKSPEFEETRDATRWRYRGPGSWWTESEDAKPAADPPASVWLDIARLLAQLGRVVGWLLVAALVIAALRYAGRYLDGGGLGRRDRFRPTDTLFGMDVSPASLPPDVATAARALLERGDVQAALSLLYRGALSVLMHRDGVHLTSGDTEDDCVRAVSACRPGAAAEYFTRLARAWQQAAYAQRMPGNDRVDPLCREWATHFASAGER